MMNKRRVTHSAKSTKSAKLETEQAIRHRAMDLLARREHSRAEIWKKLSTKVEDKNQLEAALDQLEEDNLLSDERFCESFVRYRQNSGYGPVRIKMELRERRVSDRLVAEYLDESNATWLPLLEDLVGRKYGDYPETDPRSRAKQQRFLAQRGYSFDQINTVLSRFASRTKEAGAESGAGYNEDFDVYGDD